MKKIMIPISLALTLFTANSFANKADVLNTLKKIGLTADNIEIIETVMPGLMQANTPDGTFYITDDGKFLTQGPVYNMQGAQPENIANGSNAKLISSIAKDAIVYRAKNEKYVISVFTDYTCHYCQMLHENVQKYNDLGITIQYFAFPREGMSSQVAKNMQSIWSTADRKKAFDAAYKGQTISPANSTIPYVQTQFDIGRKLGISGTPAIVLSNGQMVAGYVPPEELKSILDKTFTK